MTLVEPMASPTSRAEGKTLKASTNVRMEVVASPGASRGRITRRKRCDQFAPIVLAAASIDGSIPDRYAEMSRKANGNPEMTSEMNTPQ